MDLSGAVRRAVSAGAGEPVGLYGQMMWIARNTPAGMSGRPADAIGVSASQWNKWMLGARGIPGGTRPNPKSLQKIRQAVRKVTAVDMTANPPRNVQVTGKIKWNGYYNRKPVRTTTLTDMNLGDVAALYGAGDDVAMAAAFIDAIRERYGVPVEITDVQSMVFL